MSVRRVYVEKREGENLEATRLLSRIHGLLDISSVSGVRVLQRYDVSGLSEAQFEQAVASFLSEPAVDHTFATLDEAAITGEVFAVEPLPGQFDQRADSAAQCAQILFEIDRPLVASAKVYAIAGCLSPDELAAIQHDLVNPVEARLANLELPASLLPSQPKPARVGVCEGFTKLADAELPGYLSSHGLAMDAADLAMVRDHYVTEHRDPTVTELRVIDTYWSDHCRHTTFTTMLDKVVFADDTTRAAYDHYLATRAELGRNTPITLMDMGTLGAKALRAKGLMPRIDVSDEINACTVTIDVERDGADEPWLLLFKNETHNHPTEIEPFGGAATCIGGAIRDPLSGRGYVHAAMRLTGSGDPRVPLSQTLPGKLPQRTIATTSAAGYSSYGNQIGLATGIVDEFYHPGYVAKHMELGAVVAAVPADQVRREQPAPGDRVILVGGATGRDGVGGATGSSKSHTAESLTTAGAEVQKGNAPEERKLQRFFRNPDVARRIKRCNDFGAGGVAVAVGELADGLDINLDAVHKKYAGLDGTELAVSESQERMALVVDAADVDAVIELAAEENLTAVVVAEVTDTRRMRMTWQGETIVDLSRDFLDTNGAPKHQNAVVTRPGDWSPVWSDGSPRIVNTFADAYTQLVGDLNVASKQGLAERFDSTIGAGSVLMPYGGSRQATPVQAMAHLIPASGNTVTCSFMAWGFNPWITSASPYHGAYLAVVESVAKLVATGADLERTYLSFQEYFERLRDLPERWGKPVAALLGALEAQLGLGIGAIGGKDSMSGSFESLDVPPTFVSFAVTDQRADHVATNHFKAAGDRVTLLSPTLGSESLEGLPTPESLRATWEAACQALRSGAAVAGYTPGFGGIAEAVFKMGLGERLGFSFNESTSVSDLFDYRYGTIILEWAPNAEPAGIPLGTVTATPTISLHDESVTLEDLEIAYRGTLESVYPTQVDQPGQAPDIAAPHEMARAPRTRTRIASPTALVPVFPGTNCEYDTARAIEDAGITAKVFVVQNRDADEIARSVERCAKLLDRSQLVVIPGGFSGGDEPDGSAKFITSFFRNPQLTSGVSALLDDRGGLMLGICNGFQALIKLGLIATGRITDPTPDSPTLTFNRIGRHQSRIVRTRVANNASPWLAATRIGEVFSVPISHGEGRLHATDEQMRQFAERGQLATQYVDAAGVPSLNIADNPSGSHCAIEAMTSPDGRVLGKMGHSERVGRHLYRNVPGRYDMGLFRSAAAYFA